MSCNIPNCRLNVNGRCTAVKPAIAIIHNDSTIEDQIECLTNHMEER